MAFRMQQFKCKKCGYEFEELLDSRDPNQKIECPRVELSGSLCKGVEVERILAIGSSKGGHISWSKWRVSV